MRSTDARSRIAEDNPAASALLTECNQDGMTQLSKKLEETPNSDETNSRMVSHRGDVAVIGFDMNTLNGRYRGSLELTLRRTGLLNLGRSIASARTAHCPRSTYNFTFCEIRSTRVCRFAGPLAHFGVATLF